VCRWSEYRQLQEKAPSGPFLFHLQQDFAGRGQLFRHDAPAADAVGVLGQRRQFLLERPACALNSLF
jgi:hypothetical protein